MAGEIDKLSPLVGSMEGSYDRIFISHQPIAQQVVENRQAGILDGFAVQTCHGVYPLPERPAQGMDRYVAISEEVRDHLQTVEWVKSTVIHNGVNCDRYKPISPINRELKTVLSLAQTGPAVKLVKRVCEKLGLKYLYCQKLSIPVWDLERLMNEADLVVSLGRGAYEAMACGRAVVVLDSRDYTGLRCMADGIVTEDNWRGFLKYNFSGRLNRIVYDDEELIEEFTKYTPEMGVANRQIALEAFNIRHQVDKYLALESGT